ncbi:hypothetical protein [Prolixibacter sp. NT017]|uniref:hypothetical protein n=1 Tax=Prolixibacter sp. NT017 TaxID=2652390 RepID=UPI001298F585|nr:hypothetical protein [Prolixibacter sp. NT017]
MKNLDKIFIILVFLFISGTSWAQSNRNNVPQGQDDGIHQQLAQQQLFINEQMALQGMSVQAQVNQKGNYNNALIKDQSVESYLNNTTVNQYGDYNNAALYINGSGLTTNATQQGNSNTLKLNLQGNNIEGNILQKGNQHTLNASLSDYSMLRSTYNITQTGSGSNLQIQENGYNQLNGMSIKINGPMTLQLKNGGF